MKTRSYFLVILHDCFIIFWCKMIPSSDFEDNMLCAVFKTATQGKYIYPTETEKNLWVCDHSLFFFRCILWIALIPPTDITTGGLPSPSQTPSRKQPPWNKPTLLTGQHSFSVRCYSSWPQTCCINEAIFSLNVWTIWPTSKSPTWGKAFPLYNLTIQVIYIDINLHILEKLGRDCSHLSAHMYSHYT